MNLLSWHGTILRRHQGGGEKLHAGLWPRRESAEDWVVRAPAAGLSGPIALHDEADAELRPDASPRQVGWRRHDQFGHASPQHGRVWFRPHRFAPDGMFLLIAPAQIALLRLLIAHDWLLPDGAALPGDTIALGDAFSLRAGAAHFALETTTLSLEEDRLLIASAAQCLELAPVRARQAHEVKLPRRPDDAGPPEAADPIAFAQAENAWLALRGAREFLSPPLVADHADRDWLHRRYWRMGGIPRGPYDSHYPIWRERDRYVLTARGREGVVLGADGVCGKYGDVLGVPVPGQGVFTREGDDVYIDRTALAAAPHLAGSYVCFANGNLTNYYHWLIGGLLVLHMMRPHLPPGTKILLPRSVLDIKTDPEFSGQGIVDHMAAMAAWGFDDLEVVVAPPPVVSVDEIFFQEYVDVTRIPAASMQAARADVLSRRKPRRGGQRLYLRRRGQRRVSNDQEIESLLHKQGFSMHELEGMSPAEQIDLFRDADVIVTPHGAGMANLLFCAPGTRVLEITPAAEYRSGFVEMSGKLGLVHAVLPCASVHESFWTDIRVDPVKLTRLLAMLQSVHLPAAAA
jgi:hypothetical protein